jgi:hypothetical protein
MSMWSAIVAIVFISCAVPVAKEFARARGRQTSLDPDRYVERIELLALKERVEVLEKIVTDEGFDLKRELSRL